MHCWNGKDNFPPVITVFSAPNYSNSGNDGAVLVINGDEFRIETFYEQEQQPFLLPDFNPLQDSISFFHNQMMGAIYQVLYYVCGGEESALQWNEEEQEGENTNQSEPMDDLLEDKPYLERVLEKSLGKKYSIASKNQEKNETKP